MVVCSASWTSSYLVSLLICASLALGSCHESRLDKHVKYDDVCAQFLFLQYQEQIRAGFHPTPQSAARACVRSAAATPSEPQPSSAGPQPGSVLCTTWLGDAKKTLIQFSITPAAACRHLTASRAKQRIKSRDNFPLIPGREFVL